jgi:BioD-like phosphotransacetylase family protein
LVKKSIYIASTEEASGKSVVAISLASIAKEIGEKIGYFKPITLEASLLHGGEGIDEDIEVMRRILGLKMQYDVLCPLTLKRDYFLKEFLNLDFSRCAESILKSYREASNGKDIMLIEGPRALSIGAFLGCPVPKLARDFNAKVLLVLKFKDDFIVDEILQAQEYCARWDVKLLGVILNRIPQDAMGRVENVIKPFIEAQGIKVLGFIPEDKVLSALTAGEVCDFIGGEVLAGEDGLNNLIETILIGAMTPESAAKYFRKVTNELVITGGDRSDIILTALETGVSAIILTGNLYPSVKVFPKADHLKIPLIIVPYDTYTTLQHIQKIIGRIKPGDPRRINAAINLVRKNVDWEYILRGAQ